MAQYTATYRCGHTGTVRLFGPSRGRESRLAWLREHRVCEACAREIPTTPTAMVRRLADGSAEIAIRWSYEMRYALAARGYDFDPEYIASAAREISAATDPVQPRSTAIKVWLRRLPADEAAAELRWLDEQGVAMPEAEGMATPYDLLFPSPVTENA